MYLINYHLYANTARMNQMMAEDTGAAELRNPVDYLRTGYRAERTNRFHKEGKTAEFSEANVSMGKQGRPAVGSV